MRLYDGENIINNKTVRHRDGRAYTRGMRHHAISRKKAIVLNRDGDDWYKHDGQYSKGKIHCGCKICKWSKHYHLPTLRTEREIEKFKYDVKDYESEMPVMM